MEREDGFSSPLQQYESFESSDIVSQPTGPMWWTPGTVEPVYRDGVEVSAEYQGGILDVSGEDAYASAVEIVDGETFTVLE